ncbi:hypothetical protein PENSPDRAFT_649936 [Peniophora sp. CONT]|nr:hypothetical protein PENSPDRAFT_649936 [Peniophora sp. CONT]
MNYTAQLPTETLCLIFHFARLNDSIPITNGLDIADDLDALLGNDFKQKRAVRFLAWIHLTHVCERWRKVALEDASLWADIPTILGGHWLETFLSRSKQLPITIRWRGDYTPSAQERMETIISAQHTRMRTFAAEIESGSTLSQVLCRPWPALEDLHIAVEGDFTSSTFTLFDNYAPSLRHMSLDLMHSTISSSHFDWNTSILDNLVVLDIMFSEGIETTSMNDLVHALARMSRLQHLRIVGHDEGLPSPDLCEACLVARREPVPLLQSLKLHTSIPMATHIMKHILPPPDVLFLFEVNRMQENDEGDKSLHGVATQIVEWDKETFPSSPYRAVEIDANEDCVRFSRELGFSKPSTESSMISPRLSDDSDFHHSISITLSDVFDDVWPAVHSDAIRTIAPGSIRALSLRVLLYEEDIDLRFCFSHATYANVAMLRLEQMSVEFLRLMDDKRDDDTFVLFPALKVLDILECELVNLLYPRPDHEGAGLSNLLRMLECRRARNPLHAVYLRVANEVLQVRAGNLNATSVPDLPGYVVLQGIAEMEAAQEFKIITFEERVPYPVDVLGQ